MSSSSLNHVAQFDEILTECESRLEKPGDTQDFHFHVTNECVEEFVTSLEQHRIVNPHIQYRVVPFPTIHNNHITLTYKQ